MQNILTDSCMNSKVDRSSFCLNLLLVNVTLPSSGQEKESLFLVRFLLRFKTFGFLVLSLTKLLSKNSFWMM